MKHYLQIITKNIFYSIALLSQIVISGCTSHSNPKYSTIQIDCTKKISSDRAFDSLFKYNSYIILEETPKSKISSIDKICISDDRIIILDNRTRILIFDKKGKFINSVEHRGHGNGEYLSLSDFITKEDTLYCLDRIGGKILAYSLDGKYLHSKDVSPSKGFFFLNNGTAFNQEFGLANGKEKDFYSYSYITNKNEVLHYVKYNKALNGKSFSFSSGSNSFFMSDESLFYCIPYNDIIYEINKDTGEPSPFMRIILGDRVIQEGDDVKRVTEILNSSVPSNIFAFYKWENLLIFSYYGEDDIRQYVFYDQQNGLIHNAPLSFDENQLPISIMNYDNYCQNPYKLLSNISPISIRMIYEKQEDKNMNPVLQELYRQVLDNENPVLIFYDILHP